VGQGEEALCDHLTGRGVVNGLGISVDRLGMRPYLEQTVRFLQGTGSADLKTIARAGYWLSDRETHREVQRGGTAGADPRASSGTSSGITAPREAKFYQLTRAGRVQLDKELAQWERLSSAVGLVIRAV
jgi:hypothetical protein